LIQRIKLLLSSALAARICLLVAILSKLGLMRIYLNVGTDKAALLISTKNFLAGHGISIGRTFITDLADKTYVPYTGWPPGYSLLLSPFLSLFPDNFMLAAFCVDMLAAIIFFVFLQKILLQLGFSPWLAALFLLFQGVFVNDYIVSSHPTDFLAMAFVVAGWYYCNLLFGKERKWTNQVLCIFFLGFATLIRYQYMPVCVLGMCWAFYTGWKQHQNGLKNAAACIAISLVTITVITLFYQKNVSGHFLYQLPGMTKGWYPGNIFEAAPFSLNSFIEINFWGVQLSSFTGAQYTTCILLFKIIAAGLLVFFGFTCLNWFRKKYSTSFSATDNAWVTGTLVSIGIVFILFWLSITNSRQTGTTWTFVKDGRYFAFVILFIQLFVWQKVFGRNFTSKIIRSAILPLLLVLYSFAGLHDVYIIAKKSRQPISSFKNILPAQPDMKVLLDYIAEQRKVNPGKTICIAGTDNQFGYFADWYGANALFYDPPYLTKAPETSKPVTLLVAFQLGATPFFKELISRPGFSFYKQNNGWLYYTLQAEPGKTTAP